MSKVVEVKKTIENEGIEPKEIELLDYDAISSHIHRQNKLQKKKMKRAKLKKRIRLSIALIVVITSTIGVKSFAFNDEVEVSSEVSFSQNFNGEMEQKLNSSLGAGALASSETKEVENIELSEIKEEGEVVTASEIVETEDEKETEDIVITINPTVKGEEFAVYNTEIQVSLKAKDIKEKSFKFKDVEIEVIDVNADLTSEEAAMLPKELIEAIAEESTELKKKVAKEIASKEYKEYIEKLINEKI